MASDDTKLELLSGHYVHTFDVLQTHLKRRDRLFAVVLVVLIVMLFQIYTPDAASNLIAEGVKDQLGIETPVDLLYVASTVWFVLLAAVVRYFQVVVFIERQYEYLGVLEARLSTEYDSKAFTREGVSYSKDYPLFLNWASFLYTILFPAVLGIVVIAKIVGEIRRFGLGEVLIWFDLLIAVLITVSIALYLHVLHFRKREERAAQT